MKLTHLSVGALCAAMAFAGCQKEQPVKQSSIKGKGQQGQLKNGGIENYFRLIRGVDALGMEFASAEGTDVYTPDGTRIMVKQEAFQYADGTPYNGTVYMSYLENFTRFDMISRNYVTEDLDGFPLNTGGSFNIGFRDDQGQELNMIEGTVEIRIPAGNTGGFSSNMTMWTGVQSAVQTRDVAWVNTGTVPDMDGGTNTYNLILPNPGEHNIDEPESTGGSSGTFSTLRVVPPPGVTDENTEVFVTYENRPGVVTSMDNFGSSGTWTENTIRSGVPGNIVALSVVDGLVRVQVTPFNVDNFAVITLDNLQEVSTEEFEAIVNSLP